MEGSVEVVPDLGINLRCQILLFTSYDFYEFQALVMSSSRCFRHVLVGLLGLRPIVLFLADFVLEILHLSLVLSLNLLHTPGEALVLLLCQAQLVRKVVDLLRALLQLLFKLLLLLFEGFLFALQFPVDSDVLSLFEGQILEKLLVFCSQCLCFLLLLPQFEFHLLDAED